MVVICQILPLVIYVALDRIGLLLGLPVDWPSFLGSVPFGSAWLWLLLLFQEGFRPAIDIGLSVSRIGSRVQPQGLSQTSGGLRLDYLQYKELMRFLRLRTRLADEVKQKLERGRALVELFLQPPHQPVEIAEEIILFYAFQRKILEILSLEGRQIFRQGIMDYLRRNNPELVNELNKNMQLSEEVKKGLNQGFAGFCQENKVF